MSSEAAAIAFFNHLMSMPFFRDVVGADSGSGPSDRLFIINPVTRSMIVVAGADFEYFDEKKGEPPASKAEIEGLKTIDVKSCQDVESLGGECVICMEEYKVGDVAKEMPCQHKFHGECVDKWLKIHGTCPVCRLKVGSGDDVDEKSDDVDGNSDDVESERVVRREIWLDFISPRRSNDDDGEGSDEEY
uniref:E3 ubiquitin-protein ligase MPSR1 n=1 Tax=Erigeron canadensis TaxID=72917 RepID=UPI001CB978A9|nr:E3 ubiquitin-protein ligase MPSR1 [Erigeron canadensis]